MIFCIKIADLVVEIHSLYDKVYDYCKDYLVLPDKKPDIIIHMSEDDISDEKYLTSINDDLKRISTKTEYSARMLEVYATHRKIADALLPFGCLVFHGSVVALKNEGEEDSAIIFTAKSGVGKTTHSNLWIENLGNTYILNGDKPILKFSENGIYAYGSPWQGKERSGCNKKAKVRAICFLERFEKNHLKKENSKDVYVKILQQCHRPKSRDQMLLLLDLLEKFECDFYTLKCNNFKNDALDVALGILDTT